MRADLRGKSAQVSSITSGIITLKTAAKGEYQMGIYKIDSFTDRVKGNSYVGRGIVTGLTPSGKAASAYFIMGRSPNSRNRLFAIHDKEVYTEPFDESKVEDPSLIIYAAIRTFENFLIVTNGDQTDTIYEGLARGLAFPETLEERQFEPDAPNLTPRISSITDLETGNYEMSILKSADAEGTACNRFTFSYEALPGLGHFIHTYVEDGSPLPTFQGEPERVAVPDDIDAFAQEIWEALDEDNKISLYVRYTDLPEGTYEERLINRYEK